jgi:hypothetical protein
MNHTAVSRRDTSPIFTVGAEGFPRIFDFSSEFEDVGLLLVPSLLLLVLAPARYIFLFSKQNHGGGQFLKLGKLVR